MAEQPSVEVGGADAPAAAVAAIAAHAAGPQLARRDGATDRALAAAHPTRALRDGQVLGDKTRLVVDGDLKLGTHTHQGAPGDHIPHTARVERTQQIRRESSENMGAMRPRWTPRDPVADPPP